MTTVPAPNPPMKLIIAALILIPIVFLSSLFWLKDQPDWLVWTLGGIATLLELSLSLIVVAVKDRQIDEWHRGALRFGTQWGWQVGAGLIPLLVLLPPV